MKTPIIVLNEWDGDMSSAVGGFDITLKMGRVNLICARSSYDTPKERTTALKNLRRRARTLTKKLGFEVEEHLL